MPSRSSDSESSIYAALKDFMFQGGGSFRQRMQTLCDSLIASGDYKEVYDILSAVEALEARLGKITFARARVQQGSFVSDSEQSPTRSLQKTIRTIERSLEDLLMSAMEGLDVSQLAHRGLLLYQNAPDITL